MDVGVVGCGYVGLASAVGLSIAGHHVTAVEIDPQRRAALLDGELPFDEPHLREHIASIRFVARVEELRAEMVLVAVPTDRDPSAVISALAGLSRSGARAVLIRSTVSPSHIPEILAASAIPVVLNPEFLREGHALRDLQHPDRLVLGGPLEAVEAAIEMYRPLYGDRVPVIRTDPCSAALGKLASNAMLSVRVAFANDLARLSCATGADLGAVRDILTSDPRIGASHLRSSTGIGGPCLPKDGRLLLKEAALHALPLPVLSGALDGDAAHLRWMIELIERWLCGIEGKKIAFLGVSFKPGSGDLRGSTSLALLSALVERGAVVSAHDPAAVLQDAAPDPMTACKDAEILVLATPWPEYLALDPDQLQVAAKRAFDPAGVLPARWRQVGFEVRP